QGMFWTWNTGYIMAKLEGTASSSMIAGKQFTYHIGGFRNNQNTTRNIELKSPVFTHSISIVADASVWFKDIDITKTPICHSPGALAIRFANNYSTMFSINQQP
ncbi:MAG: MbnP family protein, partial [Sediminibacterium sp.]